MRDWLDGHLRAASPPRPASSDASFRRYFRIDSDGTSYVLMDAPPAQEDCRPFVHVARWLAAQRLPAPRVLAEDLEQGFLLLSDLGAHTMLDVLHAATTPAAALYDHAQELLIALQGADQRRTLEVPDYTPALLQREMDLFRDWYLRRHCGLDWGAAEEAAWAALCALLQADIAQHPRVLVHRDYHSRNLMHQGAGRVAMLDFQDAVRGSVCYDLISLLRDCYWQLDEAEYRARVEAYFLQAQSMSILPRTLRLPAFRGHCELMAVQRHLKASGIFARLNLRDGKPGYLADIPRTLGYVRAVCARRPEPELAWLGGLLERDGVAA